ncbi:DICT sensory domain-containing protein [Halopenitus sp. H-Gu1]|uniref:DICT sensory domain-containing protein n=1 Tax=Halopenitus sp. H-Gu1 TaxID=3242697 RepID=UPI00359D02DA
MSLIELITGVESQAATLTVINAESDVRETLAERFGERNLVVTEATLTGGPREFAVLSRNGEFLTAVSLTELLDDGEETTPGFEDGSYRSVLDHLDETTFTSYSTEKMIAASREIEDRAWRTGSGELHAGFQTLATLAPTVPTYNRLCEREGLTVHAYAAPEGDVSDTEFPVHVERAPEIRETWFVAYDGGGTDVNKCALLAEEREPGRFYGFWSYAPETVDQIIDYLTRTYGMMRTDGDDDGSQ